MTMIKTWRERCEEHPDHEGIVTERMIRNRMQEEIDELRQAIAEAETQKPVECMCGICKLGKREWVGLTEIEICDIEADELTLASSETFAFARAIEAKLKEKNGG
jgi:hypothetical protein